MNQDAKVSDMAYWQEIAYTSRRGFLLSRLEYDYGAILVQGSG
jgi:hypothetical protein